MNNIFQEIEEKYRIFTEKNGKNPTKLILSALDFAKYNSYLAENFEAPDIRKYMTDYEGCVVIVNVFCFKSRFELK